MSAILLDGRPVAAGILDQIAGRLSERRARGAASPHLAVVLVGDDPSSHSYVRGKRRDAERVGMASSDHRLPASTSTEEVLALVAQLNEDPDVSGLLVQLPLPAQVDSERVLEVVLPAKDVDGLHPYNAGRLLLGQPGVRPCTPAGIVELLDHYEVPLEGRRAVIIGRSNLVGKPLALLLLARNATITICHSRTPDLPTICSEADILVSAAGRPNLVRPAMVKPGAAVVDVGAGRIEGRLAGDVDPAAAEVAGWLTPNPGGVGPMTRAMLLLNTLRAEEARRPG